MSFWMEGGLNQLARSGDLAGVRRLLDSGVPVDFIENGRFSDSPLMETARGGHLEVMQLLIDRGANVNHTDNDCFTPVTAAGGSEQWHCVCWPSTVATLTLLMPRDTADLITCASAPAN